MRLIMLITAAGDTEETGVLCVEKQSLITKRKVDVGDTNSEWELNMHKKVANHAVGDRNNNNNDIATSAMTYLRAWLNDSHASPEECMLCILWI